MRNIKIIIMIIALIIMAYPTIEAKNKKSDERITYLSDEELEAIDKTTWKIYLTSDVKNNYFNALQFTIFETDPMPLLKEQKAIAKKLNEGKNLTEFDKIIDISTSWDLIFLKKTGAEVYLINSKTSSKDSIIISANSKQGKKWVVSKIVQNKDGNISAWIIPFDAKIGGVVNVHINEKNKFDFSTI